MERSLSSAQPLRFNYYLSIIVRSSLYLSLNLLQARANRGDKKRRDGRDQDRPKYTPSFYYYVVPRVYRPQLERGRPATSRDPLAMHISAWRGGLPGWPNGAAHTTTNTTSQNHKKKPAAVSCRRLRQSAREGAQVFRQEACPSLVSPHLTSSLLLVSSLPPSQLKLRADCSNYHYHSYAMLCYPGPAAGDFGLLVLS